VVEKKNPPPRSRADASRQISMSRREAEVPVTPASGVPARCTIGRSDRVETPGNDVLAESTKSSMSFLLPAKSELKSFALGALCFRSRSFRAHSEGVKMRVAPYSSYNLFPGT
jgi:hypothetical protein